MKKKLRYGTILVDALTHQVIDLIDTREVKAVIAEYCIQIEPPVRKSEPVVAGNRASYCG